MAKIYHYIAQLTKHQPGIRIHEFSWTSPKPGKRSARIAVLITNSFPALSHTGTKPYQRLTLRR